MTTATPPQPQLPPRAKDVARHAYRDLRRPETFIVPLLKRLIEEGIRRHCPRDGNAAVLDVGCGRQPFRPLLEDRVGSYVSLDAQAVDGVTPDFLAAIDGELPAALYARGPYAFILCTEVLEHVADWSKAFANLASLLAPGGRLLLTAPHVYILHEQPYDFYRPTVHAFTYYADRHGLRVLESRQAGDSWDILGTLLGSCRFDPIGPGQLNRVLARALWRLRDLAFRIIRHGAIRRRVSFAGPTYMSNYIVLERSRTTEDLAQDLD